MLSARVRELMEYEGLTEEQAVAQEESELALQGLDYAMSIRCPVVPMQ